VRKAYKIWLVSPFDDRLLKIAHYIKVILLTAFLGHFDVSTPQAAYKNKPNPLIYLA
jgi:hypothetical protein